MERSEAIAIYRQGEDAVVEVLCALSSRVERLEEQLEQATRLTVQMAERVEELELEVERLKRRSSRNSSLPSSKDPPGTPPRPSRRKSRRKKGGQPGHEGSHRQAVEFDEVDKTVNVFPAACPCGEDLAPVPAGVPRAHQVTEIPPVKAYVTEYRLYTVVCPGCRRRVKAPLPEGVSESSFGARLHGAATTLAGELRASRERIAAVLWDLFSIRVSVGGVDAMLRRTARALDEPYHEALVAVRGSPHINVDETGWFGAWMWGVFSGRIAVYRIDQRRNRRGSVRFFV